MATHISERDVKFGVAKFRGNTKATTSSTNINKSKRTFNNEPFIFRERFIKKLNKYFRFGAGNKCRGSNLKSVSLKFFMPNNIRNRNPVEAQIKSGARNFNVAAIEYVVGVGVQPGARFANGMR